MEQKPITADKYFIAYCGLYCGSCRSYLNDKCPGCRDNVKATWCKVRDCCIENEYSSCADCQSMQPGECKKYNNFISKAFGLIFNSDRAACIQRLKEIGPERFASEMALNRRQTLRRK
jgi:hypothetical protein